jgi:hypothetical protein
MRAARHGTHLTASYLCFYLSEVWVCVLLLDARPFSGKRWRAWEGCCILHCAIIHNLCTMKREISYTLLCLLPSIHIPQSTFRHSPFEKSAQHQRHTAVTRSTYSHQRSQVAKLHAHNSLPPSSTRTRNSQTQTSVFFSRSRLLPPRLAESLLLLAAGTSQILF